MRNERLEKTVTDVNGRKICPIKPVTDEQVFYDKFSYDKSLSIARVHVASFCFSDRHDI
jgi:hypothetical protein